MDIHFLGNETLNGTLTSQVVRGLFWLLSLAAPMGWKARQSISIQVFFCLVKYDVRFNYKDLSLSLFGNFTFFPKSSRVKNIFDIAFSTLQFNLKSISL